MPSLPVPMNPLCDVTMVAQMKKLPRGNDFEHQHGSTDSDVNGGDMYMDHVPQPDHMGMPEPMCYFWTQSTLKNHVDTSKDIGKKFKDFAHAMLDGFKTAVDMWRLQAKLSSLIVNGPVVVGTPGCLSGPDLESNIKNMSLPAASGNEKDWRDAVAKGLSTCWKNWQDMVTVPGLPWYPAFAAFPGPMAPPMPNIPTPFIALPSGGMSYLMVPMLKSEMVNNYSLDDPDDQFVALATAMATAVAATCTAWLAAQQAMMVMGKGQIPTFAPPYVPVGPVIMGDNIGTPGHAAV